MLFKFSSEGTGLVSGDEQSFLLEAPNGETYAWPPRSSPEKGSKNSEPDVLKKNSLLPKVIREAIRRGLVDLSHPVILRYIRENQTIIQFDLLALRTLTGRKQKDEARGRIRDAEDKLKAVGGSEMIAAAKHDFGDQGLMFVRERQRLQNIGKWFFVQWHYFSKREEAKKLTRKAKVAVEERIGILTAFHPYVLISATEIRAWVNDFEESPQMANALEYAVNKRLKVMFPDYDNLKHNLARNLKKLEARRQPCPRCQWGSRYIHDPDCTQMDWEEEMLRKLS